MQILQIIVSCYKIQQAKLVKRPHLYESSKHMSWPYNPILLVKTMSNSKPALPQFIPKWSKSVPNFRPKWLKNHTLLHHTHLYCLYRGVNPSPPIIWTRQGGKESCPLGEWLGYLLSNYRPSFNILHLSIVSSGNLNIYLFSSSQLTLPAK